MGYKLAVSALVASSMFSAIQLLWECFTLRQRTQLGESGSVSLTFLSCTSVHFLAHFLTNKRLIMTDAMQSNRNGFAAKEVPLTIKDAPDIGAHSCYGVFRQHIWEFHLYRLGWNPIAQVRNLSPIERQFSANFHKKKSHNQRFFPWGTCWEWIKQVLILQHRLFGWENHCAGGLIQLA